MDLSCGMSVVLSTRLETLDQDLNDPQVKPQSHRAWNQPLVVLYFEIPQILHAIPVSDCVETVVQHQSSVDA